MTTYYFYADLDGKRDSKKITIPLRFLADKVLYPTAEAAKQNRSKSKSYYDPEPALYAVSLADKQVEKGENATFFKIKQTTGQKFFTVELVEAPVLAKLVPDLGESSSAPISA